MPPGRLHQVLPALAPRRLVNIDQLHQLRVVAELRIQGIDVCGVLLEEHAVAGETLLDLLR